MRINKVDNTHFGNVVSTENLFETLIGRPFAHNGYDAYKIFYETLRPNHGYVGHLGFRGQAEILLRRVRDKYPPIYADAENIKAVIKQNPQITKTEISRLVKPYIEKYGEQIDIML